MHRVARERRIDARVDSRIRAEGFETVVHVSEFDVIHAAAHAIAEPALRGTLDAGIERCARVADFVVRVLLATDPERASDTIDRPQLERALDLHAGLPLAAPAQRNRDPTARPEPIDEAGAHTIGEAVAIVVAQDRQEHPAGHESLHRIRRFQIEFVDARELVDHHHQQDVVGVVDRSESFADLDAVEAAAPFEFLRDLCNQGVGGGLTDNLADDR